MSNDKSREAFEALCESEGVICERDGDDYMWTHTSLCWEVWQASREVALSEAAEVCDALKSAYKDISESTLLTVNGKTVHQGMFGGAHNCAAAIRSMK
jgi:hypothetical protein